ncbi:MAG: hypothetical protein ACLUE2_09080 [Bacteroides cellulosilyticus]
MLHRWLPEWVRKILITDINLTRLRYLSEVLPKNVKTLYSSMHNIRMELPNIDLVIGSVLIPGDKAPHPDYQRYAEDDETGNRSRGCCHRSGRML